MKKIIALTAALVCIVLCFAACGQTEEPNKDPVNEVLTVGDIPFSFKLMPDENGVAAEAAIVSWNEIVSIITIPETVEYNGHVYPITQVGIGGNIMPTGASDRLTTLVLSKNVKVVDNSAFAMCVNLEAVRFEEGIEKICTSAFYGTALTVIDFPFTLRTIERAAFTGSTKLTEVRFNSDIETIDTGAFGHLSSIEAIYIPRRFADDLESIFSLCEPLKSGSCKVVYTD